MGDTPRCYYPWVRYQDCMDEILGKTTPYFTQKQRREKPQAEKQCLEKFVEYMDCVQRK